MHEHDRPSTEGWQDATCCGCGTGCDDLQLAVGDDGAATWRTHDCALGDEWLARRTAPQPPLAQVDGRPAELDEALDAAAALLAGAGLPLVYGLGFTSCEAQRAAVALAEALGAVIDPAGAAEHRAGTLAYQSIGTSTGTFGEIRDRTELAVVWRAAPLTTHPRLLSRLRLLADDVTLVVVDEYRTTTAERADVFVELPGELEAEALWTLRALVSERRFDRAADAGLPLDALGDLAARLSSAGHIAILHGPAFGSSAPAGLALAALVRDLSRHSHVLALPLRGEGNGRGAEDVLTWQTGYPSAVSFARGYPRFGPGELSAPRLLERGDVDAALIVTADPLRELEPAAADHLRRIPLVVVDPLETETAGHARVAIAPAAVGVGSAGTMHRMDGVPLPLRAVLPSSRPDEAEVLAALAARLSRAPAEAAGAGAHGG